MSGSGPRQAPDHQFLHKTNNDPSGLRQDLIRKKKLHDALKNCFSLRLGGAGGGVSPEVYRNLCRTSTGPLPDHPLGLLELLPDLCRTTPWVYRNLCRTSAGRSPGGHRGPPVGRKSLSGSFGTSRCEQKQRLRRLALLLAQGGDLGPSCRRIGSPTGEYAHLKSMAWSSKWLTQGGGA